MIIAIPAARDPISSFLPVFHTCLPYKLPAPPPILFSGAIKHLVWRQRKVELIIPFLCQFRISSKQGIIRANGSVIAKRAASFQRHFIEIVRCPLPFMPSLASPPKHFIGSDCYVLRYARQVFSRVPDLHKRRISQPVLGFGIAVRASAFTGTGTGINACLPDMTLFTLPVYFPFRAGKDIIRRQRQIQFWMPLRSDLWSDRCQAILSAGPKICAKRAI